MGLSLDGRMEAYANTHFKTLAGRCRTRHRRICGDAGGYPGSGCGDRALDRVKREHGLLERGQHNPVNPGLGILFLDQTAKLLEINDTI
jgi:hypothetical protein